MRENDYSYFQNRACKYFPCHKGAGEDFNCLFCYCPLYALGGGCGGNFQYTENGIKDCTNCMIPHSPGGYEYIKKNFSRISDLAKKNRKKEDASHMPLEAYFRQVSPLDEGAMAEARERQAQLAKPPGSLGRLEELSIQLAGITGQVHNKMEKKHLLVFAGDNGVVEEGVTCAPQSVTLMQTINLTRAKTGASVLAKHFGDEITVCDVGVNADIREPKVLNKKIAYGTKNMLHGPAMTREQAVTAMKTGIRLAMDTEADVYGVGEMGIGNTTTSSAILAVLLGVDVETVTGRGGGLTDEGFQRKKEVIRQAIAVNQPNREDVIDVLSKVGGFDIAAMCGAFIGAAIRRRPVVIDGFISVVAALCAARLCPNVRGYLIPSHASYEIGYRLAMEELGLQPIFLLGMRLGEGSGCPLAFEVLSAACGVINDMATFDQAGIVDDYLDEIREGDKFSVEGAE